MILRTKYLNKIRPFIDKPVIKVVSGIRRCGKSTLLKQVKEEIQSHGVKEKQIVYINKELFEFDSIRNYRDLHNFVSNKTKSHSQKTYLFIDEVQEIEEWEKAVNSFLAEDNYDIYLTGSNARMLSSDLATLIAGRYIELKMYPLTYSEFVLLRQKDPKVKGNGNLFNEFIQYGGFPGLHNLNWQEEVLRQYLGAIYNTIVLKDVITKNKIKDVSMLRSILEFISSNCGNITSAKSIRDYSKSQNRNISTDTVINYLNYASEALLIHKIKRFDILGKKVLETHEKYFLSDTGLSFTMLGQNPDLLPGKLENIVLIELLSRGYTVNIGKSNSTEIDFIAQKDNNRLYIQVSTTILDNNTRRREYDAYKQVNDHYPKYVISLDEQQFTTNKYGVKWMNIKDFLLAEIW